MVGFISSRLAETQRLSKALQAADAAKAVKAGKRAQGAWCDNHPHGLLLIARLWKGERESERRESSSSGVGVIKGEESQRERQREMGRERDRLRERDGLRWVERDGGQGRTMVLVAASTREPLNHAG